MIKFFAATLMCAIGYLIGLNSADRLRKAVGSAENLILLVDKTAFLIRGDTLNLFELFDRLRKIECLNELELIRQFPECFDANTNVRELMHKLIESDRELLNEERELLSRFADQIGTSDREGQAVFLSGLRAELVRLRDTRRGEFLEKSRLFKSVGLLCGVMAGILLI